MPLARRLLSPIWQRLSGLPPVNDGELSASQLRDLVGKDAPLILEIGANDGTHTKWFKDVFPDAIIHCFEPDARAAKVFRERLMNSKDVHLHEIAVGAISGETQFYPSVGFGERDWTASGSLHKPTGHIETHPNIGFSPPVRIPSLRLDDWCKQNGISKVDFIWMDVQGAELDVFSGAKETLLATRFLYTEYSIQELYQNQPSLRQILTCLHNFSTLIRFRNDILLRNNRKFP
jgi:FkbM family methyltransferase